MQINDMDEKRIKNTIRRMQKVLAFAFPDKTDLYIGFYALMTSKYLISRYFDNDCETKDEFQHVRKCLVKDLSEYTKMIFSKEFKGVRK